MSAFLLRTIGSWMLALACIAFGTYSVAFADALPPEAQTSEEKIEAKVYGPKEPAGFSVEEETEEVKAPVSKAEPAKPVALPKTDVPVIQPKTDIPVPQPKEAVSESSDFFHSYFQDFYMEPAISTYYVIGDRGRFRQDRLTDDQTNGGARKVTFWGKKGDVRYDYEGRWMTPYDYLSRVHLTREDGLFLNADGKLFRKYWDGSANDRPWEPGDYMLPANFADWPDDQLHTDRGNIDVEIGRPVSDNAKLILGYNLWTRKGRETLLRGEQAARTSRPSIRGIAMRERVKGVSHTISLRMPMTMKKIHEIEPMISYEGFRESQFIDSARYNNGLINQRRDFIGAPRWDDLKGGINYKSFWRDNVFVHGGYLFNFLSNRSTLSEVRPNNANSANSNLYVAPKVKTFRVSNSANAGGVLLDFLKKQKLDFRFGFRGEHAVSDSYTRLLSFSTVIPVEANSALNEGWFGEAFSLTYRGLKKTTAYLGLEMEQKRLNWGETYNARLHESVSTFGNPVIFPNYDTNIYYVDFIPRAKLTHRLNSNLKLFGEYKWQEKARYYHTQRDSDPIFYPGILGDQKRHVHDIVLKMDSNLPRTWMTTTKYHLTADNIAFTKRGGEKQDLDRHQISQTVSGPLAKQLFGYLTGAYEYYRVDTPTVGNPSNRWGKGSERYDFVGDYVLLANNLNYLLNTKTTLFTSYQLTYSLGDNKNILNEIQTGFRLKLNDTSSLEGRYEFFHFEDSRGLDDGLDDDYLGHGVSVLFKKSFA